MFENTDLQSSHWDSDAVSNDCSSRPTTHASRWGWASPQEMIGCRDGTIVPTPPSTLQSVRSKKDKKLERKLRRPGGAYAHKFQQQHFFGKNAIRGNVHKKKIKMDCENIGYDFPTTMLAIVGPGSRQYLVRDICTRMNWQNLEFHSFLVHSNDPACSQALSRVAQGFPVRLESLYGAVTRCLNMNKKSTRVILSGFGENLRQLQQLEKCLCRRIGILYFDTPLEIRSQRIGRETKVLEAMDRQKHVRTVLNKFSDSMSHVLGYFEGQGCLKRFPVRKRSLDATFDALEKYFVKDKSCSFIFQADGTEIYCGLDVHQNSNKVSIGVQTADRPFSPHGRALDNMTGQSVAWKTASRTKQEHALSRMDELLSGAELKIGTLRVDEKKNVFAQTPSDEMFLVEDNASMEPTIIEYGSHTIYNPNIHTQNIITWLTHLQINKAGHPDDWDRTFSNGYLLGQILQWYYPVDIQISLFQANYTTAAKRHNWSILKAVLKKRRLPVPDDSLDDLMNGVLQSAMAVLNILHTTFNTDRTSARPKDTGSLDTSAFVAVPTEKGLWEQQQQSMIAKTNQYIRDQN